MHKKLEAELVSLAHSILQMKNNENVTVLQKKALDIYEKLSVLKFVGQYINETPKTEETASETAPNLSENLKEEVIEVVEKVVKNELSIEIKPEIIVEEKEVHVSKEPIEVSPENEDIVEEIKTDLSTKKFTLEDELKDAISADVATQLFEKATKENPVVEEASETKQRSLNDAVFNNNLQIGLNDRIAFVKYLFDGNQEDFNRVLSQLNSFKTEKEAKNFINKMIKPDYNWVGNETYEERLIDLIERKFL